MGIQKEIKEAEDRLTELGKELTRPAGERRNMNTILAEINKARRDVRLAKFWLSGQPITADPDADKKG